MTMVKLPQLAEVREDAGLSRAVLAAKTGGMVSASTIQRAENGAEILRLKALQISKALGVQLENLTGGTPGVLTSSRD